MKQERKTFISKELKTFCKPKQLCLNSFEIIYKNVVKECRMSESVSDWVRKRVIEKLRFFKNLYPD